MKAVCFYALLALVFVETAFCADDPAQWVVGDWQVNRALTYASLKSTGRSVAEEFDPHEMVTRIIVTYTKTEVCAYLPGFSTSPEFRKTAPYRVLSIAGSQLTIEKDNPIKGGTFTVMLTFESPDRFWIPFNSPTLSGRVYSDRVGVGKTKKVDAPRSPPKG